MIQFLKDPDRFRIDFLALPHFSPPRPGEIPLRAFIRPTFKGMGQRRIQRRNSGKGHHPCARTPKRLGRWTPALKARASIQRPCGATSRPHDDIPPRPKGMISCCRDEASPRDPPGGGLPEKIFLSQDTYQTFILDTDEGFP